MPELLDIYDENMVKIGVKAREAVHRDGDWHKTFHCWICYRDGGRDFLVMQKRSATKDLYPNKLDITAAGHYQTGETIADGVREIQEELGIEVRFEDLIPAGLRVNVGKDGDKVDHQFSDVFVLIYPRDIRDYQVQVEEVAGLVVFDMDEALDLFWHRRDSITARAVGYSSDEVTLQRPDFIQTVDNYMIRILIVAKQCLNGERDVVV